jgi:hypothetical protein
MASARTNFAPLFETTMTYRVPIFRMSTLTVAVAALGVVGSIASIQSTWGMTGVWLSLVLSLAMLVLVWLPFIPVLRSTARSISLLESIRLVGLTDVENREDIGDRSLLPTAFYGSAEHEIVIVGISNFRTFDQHMEIIWHLLKEKRIGVHVLFLDPTSQDAIQLSNAEKKPMPDEIALALKVLRDEKLHAHPNFKCYLLPHRLPYTAVMIDGDVLAHDRAANDKRGQIRVQPAAAKQSQHRGIILQFEHVSQVCGFSYFAADLRKVISKLPPYEPPREA